MRIVIQGIPDTQPVVLDGIKAVILAASDGSSDGTAPSIAHGERAELMQLAAVILLSVKRQLGDRALDSIVRAAIHTRPEVTDVTKAVTERPAP